ncbi:type 4a pilus biogenesis protein PilO [Snodgrassella sp. CFCC 13594]|uniref:type 4a pilus biogenesis protein PilO n=1 Tax=Snodgrassella sp. CFCC 13594 TaxID=1775559 RepID=UPI0008341201|nr:type 4a pilus biogenesis protein PilO [Snodgrassella sp. CFCC 13594]
MANKIKLNEVNINNLYQLNQPAKMVLAVVLTIFIVVLAYFALYRDQLSQIDQLSQEEETLKQTYTQKSLQAANLDALKAELKQINSTYTILLKQLPTEAEIPNLIQELHQAAASNGLRMDSVTPNPVVNDGAIQKLPYSISLSGSYNQISQFTRDVGKLSRIVTLDTLNLQKNDKTADLTLGAIANTYKSLPPGQANTENEKNKNNSQGNQNP